jgi:outer membrane protein assembly factor BamB
MKVLQVLIPVLAASVGGASLVAWLRTPPPSLEMRVPGAEANIPHASMGEIRFTPGAGRPGNLPGSWPGFRGAAHDNVSTDPAPLAASWGGGAPKVLWSVPMGEGYASPAVVAGRVYVLDYDQAQKADAVRCLSLETGEEIWRSSYRVEVLRNHGMSRSVPAVSDKCVVTIGPKCHVLCLDPLRGSLRWSIDLVKDYGTRVPDWYAGQCPLIDGNLVLLAPGGKSLLIAVDAQSGRVVWQTPNPRGWQMSHSSIVPMEFAGRRMYVYCANEGTVGVDAEGGKLLWETGAAKGAPTYWRITPTVVPSPVILPDGRIFLTGGYDAGSLMLQLVESGGRIEPKALFRQGPEVFGAEQQTPIFYQGHLYGIRAKPSDELVCLDLEGKVLWTSAPKRFGLGPLLIAGGSGGVGPSGAGTTGAGLIYAMNDSGVLSLFRATSEKCEPLAEAKVLDGEESWGPMVPVGGRLIVRDFNKMVCLDVGGK